MSSLPTLRRGSVGQYVRNLQSALNLWSKSITPLLSIDGIFGSKTDGKVREYQRGNNLLCDGIVGAMTWGALSVLLQQIAQISNRDNTAGDRIVTAAKRALNLWGWPAVVQRNNMSSAIAAAYCADPTDPKRPRQGGVALATIFQGAGMYTANCFTITAEAERQWQNQTDAGQRWRNQHDLPAWCGIFCYFVYFFAGINTGGWLNHSNNIKSGKFRTISGAENAFKGCIGNITKGNHHFIVTKNLPKESKILSIDGNAWGPEFPDNYSLGCRSVIRKRSYTYKYLKSQNAKFYFPDTSSQVFIRGFSCP